jgi:hypothetical protein
VDGGDEDPANTTPPDTPPHAAEVVSLDKFRK